MPQPTIQYQHILNLLLNQYHDGRYLNSHPEICEWLDSNPDKTYYIQQMEDELGVVGYHNVRIWSSYEAYEFSKKKKEEFIHEFLEDEKPVTQRSVHPLVLELYEACDKKDLDLIYELKKRCRSLGLRFDQTKTNIRRMI